MKPPLHRPLGWTPPAVRRERHERERGNSAARGYDARWRKVRAAKLAKEPLCREHVKQGQVVEATEVDHIIPHRGNMELFFRDDNLQPLCKSCHSRKTATQDSTFAGGQPGGG